MADTKSMAVPGTVNYVEGQVALDGQGFAGETEWFDITRDESGVWIRAKAKRRCC